MYNKTTKPNYEEKKKKLEWLQERLRAAETDPRYSQTLTAWRKYTNLSIQQQNALKQAWAKYYREVPQSPMYALFMEQREASRLNDTYRVKELANQARAMRENGDHITMTQPSSIDPLEFDLGVAVREHQALVARIKDMTSYPDVEETKSVWVE